MYYTCIIPVCTGDEVACPACSQQQSYDVIIDNYCTADFGQSNVQYLRFSLGLIINPIEFRGSYSAASNKQCDRQVRRHGMPRLSLTLTFDRLTLKLVSESHQSGKLPSKFGRATRPGLRLA